MHIKGKLVPLIAFVMVQISGNLFSQQNFGLRCAGNWKGTMHIYSQGMLTDSIPVVLEVRQQNDSVFHWKMEYLSKKIQ